MNKFLFVLLSAVLSGLLSGIVLALISYIQSRNHADHPHQILPSWMIFFGLGFVFSAVIALLWSAYLVFFKGEAQPVLLKTVLVMASIGSSAVGLWLLYWKR